MGVAIPGRRTSLAMRTAARVAGPLLALLACACSAADGQRPDFYLHGAGVVVATSAPFARAPSFPARLEGVAAVALSYWGGDWRALEGRTITFSSGSTVPCVATPGAQGCFDGDLWVADTDPGVGVVSCVEQTVLVHEIGHAVLGDPLHQDPRWMALEPLAVALSGRVGYGSDGEVDCVVSASVWEHPLGRR